jgi:hypothetical protein
MIMAGQCCRGTVGAPAIRRDQAVRGRITRGRGRFAAHGIPAVLRRFRAADAAGNQIAVLRLTGG